MTYRFGLFAFDDETAILARSGRPVPLEPQPARALGLLLSRAGDVVSRDEVRAHLWGAETHVDFDRGLAYCIRELRSALGDSADNPRFIQTLPRRGFCFVAPVEQGAESLSGAKALPSEPLRPGQTVARRFLRRRAAWAAAGVIATVGVWAAVRGTPLSARPVVAVAVFDNETGDVFYDRLVLSLSDVVIDRLTAIGPERLGAVGNMAALRRVRDERDLALIARETRASFIVLGQLQTEDGKLTLLMHLIRLDDGTHLWTRRINRPSGDSLAGIGDEAADRIEAAVRHFVLKDKATSPDASR